MLNIAQDGAGLVLRSSEEEEALRDVLGSAPVIQELELPVGSSRCSSAIQFVILDGGHVAVWKRGDTAVPGIEGVRHEVAAYVLATILEWSQYLPVTMERTVSTVSGTATVASIEYIDGMTECAPLAEFKTEDVQRAATFDALIANDDRTHNWGGVPDPEGSGQQQLVIFDHEGSFRVGNTVISAFWSAVGGSVPEARKAELRRKRNPIRNSARLKELLQPPEHEALLFRLDQLSA